MGINVNLNDLSLELLMAVNEYAAKMYGSKDGKGAKRQDNSDVEPMSLAQMRRERKNGKKP